MRATIVRAPRIASTAPGAIVPPRPARAAARAPGLAAARAGETAIGRRPPDRRRGDGAARAPA